MGKRVRVAGKRKSLGKTRKAGKKPRTARIRWVVPLTERIKIAAAYMEGGPDNSVPKLAARFNRGQDTIYAIIAAPAVQEIGKAMEQKLVESSAEAVADRINYEVKTKRSKAGAWIAMELAERWGAIPPKITRSAVLGRFQTTTQEKPEEERVKDWVSKLTEVTMERGRIFDMPMAELDELKDEEEIEIPLKAKREKVV